MKAILVGTVCFLCAMTKMDFAFAWEEPTATTKETIVHWFETGVLRHATHLLVVCDRFNSEDFPVYVYSGQDPKQAVAHWNGQEWHTVVEVYALRRDMQPQIQEYRAWHLE